MKQYIFIHTFENLVEKIPANSKEEAQADLEKSVKNPENYELIKVKGL